MFENNNVLGIDIGFSGIKIIEVNGSNHGVTLESYHIFEIPHFQDLSLTDRLTQIENILRGYCKERVLKTNRVNLSFSAHAAFTRFVRLPAVDNGNNMRAALPGHGHGPVGVGGGSRLCDGNDQRVGQIVFQSKAA